MPYPAVRSIWRNNKTQKLYVVLYAGTHTETNEPLVVYQGYGDNAPADPDDAWCRPLTMWQEKFTEEFIKFNFAEALQQWGRDLSAEDAQLLREIILAKSEPGAFNF